MVRNHIGLGGCHQIILCHLVGQQVYSAVLQCVVRLFHHIFCLDFQLQVGHHGTRVRFPGHIIIKILGQVIVGVRHLGIGIPVILPEFAVIILVVLHRGIVLMD